MSNPVVDAVISPEECGHDVYNLDGPIYAATVCPRCGFVDMRKHPKRVVKLPRTPSGTPILPADVCPPWEVWV